MKQAIFVYIPVIHAGTLAFLSKFKGTPILLLDNKEGAKSNPHLERDMRALSADEIKKELQVHDIVDVEVVAPDDLVRAAAPFDKLLVPEDDILDFFLSKYLSDKPIERVKVFLRWTKKISETEFEVPPDRVTTKDAFAKEVLQKLFTEAEKSTDWWRQIAVAVFKEERLLVQTYNKHFPTEQSVYIDGDPRSNLDAGEGQHIYTSIHAEARALAQAARKGIPLEGADVYVTTFPCPTCARLLVEAGIQRLFYAKGYSLLKAEEIFKNAGIEIILVENQK